MADLLNSTFASNFDLESSILEIYGASIVLTEIAENTLGPKRKDRDDMGGLLPPDRPFGCPAT